MENIIVCTLLYIVIVAIAYQPKNTPASTTVEYFPEVEETTTETTEVIEEYPAAVPAFTVPTMPVMATESDLMALSIRILKKLCQGRIKGYSRLTKDQISKRLDGTIPLAMIAG